MAHNKKKNKYPAKHLRQSKTGPIVIKSGSYDGATRSTDFVVSGHSTGSPNSEMEALSQQVSRDAGAVPAVPREYMSSRHDLNAYDGYEGEGFGDLGGPEFYGDRPTLLKKSPIHFANEHRLTLSTATAALAGSAVLAGIAYALFRKVGDTARAEKTAATRRSGQRKSAAATSETKTAARKTAASRTKKNRTAAASKGGAKGGAKAAARKSTRSSRTSEARTH